MTADEQRAVLTIALMAAFADGGKSAAEREAVKGIASSFGGAVPPQLLQDVVLKRITLADAVRPLATPELRQLAYEMAVVVSEADGAPTAVERDFLASLERALGLDHARAESFVHEAEAVAAAPLAVSTTAEPAYASTMAGADMDGMILNYAILNGALELLPDSLATVAIIPLQMKMVYRIGKAHGFELDRGHIKDFLATAGVGLTSQYVEQVGAKLIGGLLKKVGGGLLGGLGRQAVSSGFSFATTYALGHVARRYYAGGRTLSAAALREAFDGMLGEAKGLQTRYAGEIEARARSVNLPQLLAEVRR
ncbi:MAG TPA: GTPase [Pelomicrobium sp.]|nr:GTPase [Pelomicrobium sp.]